MPNATMIDEAGKRYGRWRVIGLGKKHSDGRQYWLCECECGTIRHLFGWELRSGRSKSCGCGRGEIHRMPDGGAALNELYSTYCRHAAKRGYSFAIDKDDFRSLTSESCHYCGAPPTSLMRGTKSKSGYESEYRYNGLDRIDNDAGYLPGNVVPCCKRCNVAKNDMSYDEFLSWARKLAARLFTKG